MEQEPTSDSSSSSSDATNEPNQPNYYQNLTQSKTSLLGRSQDIQPQGLLIDQAAGSSGLYQSGGTWNQIQFPTIPIQQGMEACSIRSALPLHDQEKGLSTNYSRMKMAWEKDIPARSNLQLTSRILQGQGTPSASTSRPRSIKNGVYDAIYEVIGLPVDPHLRMFVARGDSAGMQ
ncbi:uncharacterized protein LOC132168458 [Corylus avellana]|nr:uncharacterized protein LOC132168458 [Corylus avellana]